MPTASKMRSVSSTAAPCTTGSVPAITRSWPLYSSTFTAAASSFSLMSSGTWDVFSPPEKSENPTVCTGGE